MVVAEAATHARVSRDTVYSAIERGELRHVRLGGRRTIRIRASWVDDWLERHARGAATTAVTTITVTSSDADAR